MLFNSPLSEEKAIRIIQRLDLVPGNRVLDAGCGNGEFLIRVLRASGARGLGIDIDPDLIARARESVMERVPQSAIEFRAVDMQKEPLEENAFEVAVCMGSTHAFGSGDAAYPSCLEALTRVVRPGGRLLIGEGYWKQPPAKEYLEFLGDPSGIYRDHQGNIAFAEERGLTPLYAAVSSDDEWDDFEWSHRMRVEREAAAHPDDAEWKKKLERSRAWRNGYLRWGRSTMGFGFYVFATRA